MFFAGQNLTSLVLTRPLITLRTTVIPEIGWAWSAWLASHWISKSSLSDKFSGRMSNRFNMRTVIQRLHLQAAFNDNQHEPGSNFHSMFLSHNQSK